LPIDDLRLSDFTFCQFFLRSETRKLIAVRGWVSGDEEGREKRDAQSMTFPRTASSVIWTWPTATPRHRTCIVELGTKNIFYLGAWNCCKSLLRAVNVARRNSIEV